MSSAKTLVPKRFTIDYVKNKSVLVYDKNAVARSTVANIFGEMEVPARNITLCNQDYKDLLEKMSNGPKEIVVCNSQIEGGRIEDVLAKHIELLPDRLEGSFFAVNDQNSVYGLTSFLVMDIDALVSAPYTIMDFHNTIVSCLERKSKPTEKLIQVMIGRKSLYEGDLDQASAIFRELIEDSKHGATACSYLGKLEEDQERYTEARDIFLSGLKVKEANYRCLNGVIRSSCHLEEFDGAYDAQKKMLGFYPPSEAQLPELLKLAIITGHFNDVFDLADAFKDAVRDNAVLLNPLGAALGMAGKYLLFGGERISGIDAIRRAIGFRADHAPLVESCIAALSQADCVPEAMDILERQKAFVGSSRSYGEMIIHYYSKDFDALFQLAKTQEQLVDVPLEGLEMLLKASDEHNLDGGQRGLIEAAFKKRSG